MKKAMKYLFGPAQILALLAVLSGTTIKAQVTQDQMVQNIRSALIKLPYYGVYDYLEFSINGRTVTLKGYASRPSLKNDAQAAVKDVKGVEEVVNNVEVLPLSPNDDRIRRTVYNAVYGTPALQRYGIGANPPIHIIVKNGNVRLEGVVSNENDKNIAGMQAQGVGGTFKVKNDLRIESASQKTQKAE